MNMYFNIAWIPSNYVFSARTFGWSCPLCIQSCSNEYPLSKTPDLSFREWIILPFSGNRYKLTKQNRVFNTLCLHVGFRVGELANGGIQLQLEIAWDIERWELLCAFSLFVLYILLISIVVVTIHFVCCCVKLPLSWLTSPCLFLSILLLIPRQGGAIEWPLGPLLLATAKLQHCSKCYWNKNFS